MQPLAIAPIFVASMRQAMVALSMAERMVAVQLELWWCEGMDGHLDGSYLVAEERLINELLLGGRVEEVKKLFRLMRLNDVQGCRPHCGCRLATGRGYDGRSFLTLIVQPSRTGWPLFGAWHGEHRDLSSSSRMSPDRHEWASRTGIYTHTTV